MNKLLDIYSTYRNWFEVYLDRLNLLNIKKLYLRNGLIFYTLSKGSRPIISETIGRKRYNIFRDIKSKDIVVDIGAYVGDFSLYAGSKGAKVYAYEPFKKTFDILNRNIAINNLQGNVKAFNKGIYYVKGLRKMNLHKLETINSLVKSKRLNKQSKFIGKCNIETITLKDIFRENNLKFIDFLKIDTEGSEADIILSTPTKLLRKIRYIAMESTDYENTNRKNIKLLSYLLDVGFKIEVISNNNTINIIKIFAWIDG